LTGNQKGFSLLEIAIAIVVLSVITITMIGWQVNQNKEALAREIVSTLIAIDIAYYQLDVLVKNGGGASCNIPIPPNAIFVGGDTTSATDDTGWVCVLRNTRSWITLNNPACISNVRNANILVPNYLDPRASVRRFASSGVVFQFNFDSGTNTLNNILVQTNDTELLQMVNAMINDSNKFTVLGSTGIYRLNNGNGYRYTPANFICN
jgi:prepilin-type N-terminal cleavage/methylation domain-containing protein